MACLGECWDLLGPPPDTILSMPPPPPLPAFMQAAGGAAAALLAPPLADLLLLLPGGGGGGGLGQGQLPGGNSNATVCSAAHLCDALGVHGMADGAVMSSGQFNTRREGVQHGGGGYVEMPRKDVETWAMNGIDDTWLLVLVASSIGVLLLGALLAMFLLKCREMNMFASNDCSMHNRDSHHAIHRQLKTHHEARECSSSTTFNPNTKLVHPSEAVLYHHGGPQTGTLHQAMDNRMVWAALTPRGTQHFFSESYEPRGNLVDYTPEVEDHYETIDSLAQAHQANQNGYTTYGTYQKDYEYEDPAPLIENYHHPNDQQQQHPLHHHRSTTNTTNNRQQHNNNHHEYAALGNPTNTTNSTSSSTSGGNTDMRCAATMLLLNGGGGVGGSSSHASAGTMKRSVGLGSGNGTLYRPRVSEPQRIEHPNLPPLNMFPQQQQGQGQQLQSQQQQPLQGRGNTLKKNSVSGNGTLQLGQMGTYRNGGSDTLPKFAC